MAKLDDPLYPPARDKVEELRRLLDEMPAIHNLHLETLDAAIHVLKGGLPLRDHGTIPGDVEGQR